ncbi:GNAT family N-acetyltransferase [Sphingomonas sp.]|uniref:GNAT family N-acetyltransferase n=1 Tax=Sphingomonas sp. TaxID=28214 RepID=UPI001D328D87|nr:GNAT family N-acetyltransferase [Sphingomonas sp.]MBX9796048.1 GNAT family N-acetyltransferase [Sphingomonas sp.]
MTGTLSVVDLRSATPAHLPVVEAIMQRAFDPRYGEAWTRAQCLGILAMPGVWLTMASVQGTAAGFALARAGGGEAELLLLATDPAWRRRGVGSALMRSVVNDARFRSAGRLFLEVRANNDAINFYKLLGFAKVGERRGYYRGPGGQAFDAYTLELKIS